MFGTQAMKSAIPFVLALLLFTGCDQPVEVGEAATDSEEAVATRLDLPTETIAFEEAAVLADQLLQAGGPVALTGDRRRLNARATLGRVLFYETQLSRNGTISCASCHKQEEGFSDSRRLSVGFDGEQTERQAMSVANVRFYRSGRMFWDERSESLAHQALEPIQHPVEMGLTLEEAVQRLEAQPYYESLFIRAFGDDDITPERIGAAISDFERAIVSVNSKYDRALAAGLEPIAGRGPGGTGAGGAGAGGPGVGGPGAGPGQNGPGQNGLGPDGTIADPPSEVVPVLSALEDQGRRLFFSPRTRCSTCHRGNVFVGDIPRNNGLDLDTSADQGAGDGAFKTASLRNIELTAPYMHDGRFSTLSEVVEHYNSGIQAHPDLDNRLKNRRGQPLRMNLSEQEKQALVAFMKTLTDHTLATDERFSNPFVPRNQQISPDSRTAF